MGAMFMVADEQSLTEALAGAQFALIIRLKGRPKKGERE
jgi:hypothetical protein